MLPTAADCVRETADAVWDNAFILRTPEYHTLPAFAMG